MTPLADLGISMWFARWQMSLNCKATMRDQGLAPYLSDIWWDGVWFEPWDVIVLLHSVRIKGEDIKVATVCICSVNGKFCKISSVFTRAERQSLFIWTDTVALYTDNTGLHTQAGNYYTTEKR